ncbi:MAG: hypothetical protein ACLPXZ_13010 [Mycobacterium sp.]
MKDDESIVSAEVPEADAVEQHRPADFDDETGLDTADLSMADRDANEADVIDQATVVAEPDDEWDIDR